MAKGFMDITKWKKWQALCKKVEKELDNYNSEDDDDVSYEDVVSWNRSGITDGFYDNIVSGGLYQLRDGKKFIVLGKGRGSDEIDELSHRYNLSELEYSLNYDRYAGWYKFCKNDWIVVTLLDNEILVICEELGDILMPMEEFEYFYENLNPGETFDLDDLEVPSSILKYRGKNEISLMTNQSGSGPFDFGMFRDMKRIA